MYVNIVLNEGCCRTSQHNLPDKILRHDFNATLNQSYVIVITFVSKTYEYIRGGDQYLPSIHLWGNGPGKVMYVPLFLTSFFQY